MTGAHFRWGAVSGLEPGSGRLRLLIFPPRTTAWQRRCASTAAIPICGWGALLVGFVLYAVGLKPIVAIVVAVGLFVLGAVLVAVSAVSVRRGSIELVALDSPTHAGEIGSSRLREPTELMVELVSADNAFNEERISRKAFDGAWADAYRHAVRLSRRA